MLTELYCTIDDFGKLLKENLGEKNYLVAQKQRML